MAKLGARNMLPHHDVRSLEFRLDRPYDETSPGTVFHPNGTQMACMDRALTVVLVREALNLMLGEP